MCLHIAVRWKLQMRGSAIFCAHRHTQHTEWPLFPQRKRFDHLKTSFFINSSQRNGGPPLSACRVTRGVRRGRKGKRRRRWDDDDDDDDDIHSALNNCCVTPGLIGHTEDTCRWQQKLLRRWLEVVQEVTDTRGSNKELPPLFCFLLFCTMTNKCTIISQIITLLHVSTLSCHLQTACNQYLAKLHKYFKCSCR